MMHKPKSFYEFIQESIKRENKDTSLSLNAMKKTIAQDVSGLRGGVELECFFPITYSEWFSAFQTDQEFQDVFERWDRLFQLIPMELNEIMTDPHNQRMSKKYPQYKFSRQTIHDVCSIFYSVDEIDDEKERDDFIKAEVPVNVIQSLNKNKKDFPDFRSLVSFCIYQGIFELMSYHNKVSKMSQNRTLSRFFLTLVKNRLESSTSHKFQVVDFFKDKKDYHQWSLVADGSLWMASSWMYQVKDETIYVPVEIVSPVLDQQEIEPQVKSIMQTLVKEGALTNDSTGFHFSFSAKNMNQHMVRSVNWTVFLLRFFEVGVLSKWGRLENEYTKSIIKGIQQAREGKYTPDGQYIKQGLYGYSHSIEDKKTFASGQETDWKYLADVLRVMLEDHVKPWEMMDGDESEVDRYFSVNFEHMNSEDWRVEVRALGGNYIQKSQEAMLEVTRILEAFIYAQTPLDKLLEDKKNVFFLYRRVIQSINILEPTPDKLAISSQEQLKKTKESSYYRQIKFLFDDIKNIPVNIQNDEVQNAVRHLKQQIEKFRQKFISGKLDASVLAIKKFVPYHAGERNIIDDVLLALSRNVELSRSDQEAVNMIRQKMIIQVKELIKLWRARKK